MVETLQEAEHRRVKKTDNYLIPLFFSFFIYLCTEKIYHED